MQPTELDPIRVLITGAGGSPATNFVRSLRQAPGRFHLIGVDADKYCLCRAETDERYMVPRADDQGYLEVLLDIASKTSPQLVYIQTDFEIRLISPLRAILEKCGLKTFLPDHNTIQLCQNKYDTQQVWQSAGLTVPQSMMVNSRDDVELAFKQYEAPVWLRATFSAGGGTGSFCAKNVNQACHWIDFCEGWGKFCAAAYLPGKSVTWTALYRHGTLLAAQSRERLYWEFANRAPSGVTGITGTGVTIASELVDQIAQRVVDAVDNCPHGIFAVDLTYDRAGVPNPTEINIGRFFTTHEFFTRAGLNLPWLYVCAALNLLFSMPTPRVNPLPSGLAWVRGMDFLPVLTTVERIEDFERELQQRLAALNFNDR